jgi:hypothetical protein
MLSGNTLVTENMVRLEMERCRSLFAGAEGDVHIGREVRGKGVRADVSIPVQELLSPDGPILYDMAMRNLMEAEGKPRIHYSVDFVEGRLVSVEHYETSFGSGVFEVKSSE